jgi:hypothetical protein
MTPLSQFSSFLKITKASEIMTIELPKNQPLPPLTLWKPLIIVGLTCIFITIFLCFVAFVLSRPQKKLPEPSSIRISTERKSRWKTNIETVTQDFHEHRITQTQAMNQLAIIVRTFASEAMGTDLSTKTLAELNQQQRNKNNSKQLDLLRQTIAALYPPEFADPQINRQAHETQVTDAANWVSTLVEEW